VNANDSRYSCIQSFTEPDQPRMSFAAIAKTSFRAQSRNRRVQEFLS
jgi:hypothetical protein